MAHTPSLDKSKNKSFIINHGSALKRYAQKNHEIFGQGIVVINLLLLNVESIEQLSLPNKDLISEQEITVHKPISYIPKLNFWFKMICLKIKQKYQIDIQAQGSFDNKTLIVFIKDTSIEHFSIYSIKI